MSQSAIQPTGEERRTEQDRANRTTERNQPKQLDALHTENGDTTIADTVVAKIAGIAAREVPGVYAMGSATRRAIGSLAQRIPGGDVRRDVTGGVSVQTGQQEAAVDISIVVEYGAAIVDVADQIRDNVIRSVEQSTGLRVVSVDVNVTDVHLPDDDDQDLDTASAPR